MNLEMKSPRASRKVVSKSGDSLDKFIDQLVVERQKHGPRSEFYEMKERMAANPLSGYLEQMEANLKTVVMVLDQQNIQPAADDPDYVIIRSKPLKDRKVSEDPRFAICQQIPYGDQPSASAIGSGFFIAENTVATAAHVVVGSHVRFQDVRFVHGIHIEGPGSFEKEIRVPKSKVFKPKENQTAPDAHYLSKLSSDWALVKVVPAYEGPAVPAIQPVLLPGIENYTDTFENKTIKGRRLYGIGHGLGLPLKMSYAGQVSWFAKSSPYFETDLTLLGGNSGSPIFDARTHELLGIYIRGTKKLTLDLCGDGPPRLTIKDEATRYEGQECQRLEPVLQALVKISL